jgi:hypothetical protein
VKSSLACLALTLCASAALAEPPTPAADTQQAASALVKAQVVQPLQKAESRRKAFSRVMPVAVERRVRVLDAVALTDARGASFVRFAVDVRRGWVEDSPWETEALLGCAYPETEQVFVQRGSRYFAAASLVGKATKPVPDVCRAAPSAGTQVASKS